MDENFQKKTDVELVESFNSLVSNQRYEKASFIYLQALKQEFDRRNWNYNVIMNPSGEFNLSDGNHVSLIDNKLFLEHQYILGSAHGKVVIGEIINRTRLWITLRILAPFIGWENWIGIPNQALGTDSHFGTIKGNVYVEEYGLNLLIESYEKVKIIDENIDAFVGLYDEHIKKIKEIDRLEESEIKKDIKRSMQKEFYYKLITTYGLLLSIYDRKQFEKIILAYKTDKRKIYLNKDLL